MNLKEKKFVRFQDWSSEKSPSSEQQYSNENGFYARKTKQIFFSVWDTIRRGWEMVSERIRSLKKPLRFDSRGARRAKEPGPKKKILDPQGLFLQKWNKIIMIVCVLAVAIDPLFFYIPPFFSRLREGRVGRGSESYSQKIPDLLLSSLIFYQFFRFLR
ncbi:CYCLIC NUCLEOTIDE-GATED ION CHANNEL 10-RELATED [Salix purpurea]|uniref:CYCLIC NUCLEOTIDE-GATED ION CHANNEL 10-RELATED n=1 Tax=Salix purpurea TaxID=77065 RepID=A0A9Q0SJL0_SALPP|nr:CYCLIC NUCLEOTIDE-GATED ION CHANNEL 10-RELATED [Salix purpurea]